LNKTNGQSCTEKSTVTNVSIRGVFVRLISHQPAVLFSQNKPATSNQPTVLFSHNKSTPAISHHQPNEQADRGITCFLSSLLILIMISLHLVSARQRAFLFFVALLFNFCDGRSFPGTIGAHHYPKLFV
jgi:hypothetical protein